MCQYVSEREFRRAHRTRRRRPWAWRRLALVAVFAVLAGWWVR